jgi:hypothetical protein
MGWLSSENFRYILIEITTFWKSNIIRWLMELELLLSYSFLHKLIENL